MFKKRQETAEALQEAAGTATVALVIVGTVAVVALLIATTALVKVNRV